MIETQQLRHLVAVVEHGNLVRAAEAVHISQSGLSRSIRALEQRVGYALVVRRSNGVEPTEYGLALARRARLILKDLAGSIKELQTIADGQSGELTLGITPSYTRHIVPEVVMRISQLHARLRITVLSESIAELLTMLRRGEIDVAFGLAATFDRSEDIVFERLARSQSVVVGRLAHPLCHKEKITVADLAAARWVLLSGPLLISGVAEFFALHGLVMATPPLVTNSIALAKRLILGADSLTIVQRGAIAEELEDERLVALACAVPAPRATLVLAYRREAIIGTHLKLLIDALRSAGKSPRRLRPTSHKMAS